LHKINTKIRKFLKKLTVQRDFLKSEQVLVQKNLKLQVRKGAALAFSNSKKGFHEAQAAAEHLKHFLLV
jgi:DNA-binding transcriptional regulator WhiA